MVEKGELQLQVEKKIMARPPVQLKTLRERDAVRWEAFWTTQLDFLEKRAGELVPSARELKSIKDGLKQYGRPLKAQPQDLFDLAIAYLRACVASHKLPGIALMCDYLDINKNFATRIVTGSGSTEGSRKAFEFFKRILVFVEAMIEDSSHEKGNPAAEIFALKNFGWVDKIEIAPSMPGIMTEEERVAIRARMRKFAE